MKTIKIFNLAGDFAERGGEVVLDFAKVESVTQSFVHALLSEVMREFSTEILDKIAFKNCNDTVKGIVNIVVDYMQS